MKGGEMQGTYYQTDRLFGLVLALLILCIFYIMILRAELKDERAVKIRARKSLKKAQRKARKNHGTYRI